MANETVKSSIEDLSSKVESIKTLLNTMYQELYRWSATANGSIEVAGRVEKALGDLGKISNDVSKDSLRTNQEMLNQIKTAVDLFTNNKTQISKEIIESLNFDEKIDTFESKLNQIIANVKTINESSQFITDVTNKLTLSINQLNMNITLLNKSMSSLGLPTNYAEEAGRVIDYMLSRRKGPQITFGELALKFNQNVVRQVLMTMHKLKYIEWR